jgi:hypothetical protein
MMLDEKLARALHFNADDLAAMSSVTQVILRKIKNGCSIYLILVTHIGE